MEILIDYQVHLINFPTGKTKEAVTENEDGSYTIFIEEKLSKEGREKGLLHAMEHIDNDEFFKYDIQKIEFDAHASWA